jgi:hypothetical protein
MNWKLACAGAALLSLAGPATAGELLVIYNRSSTPVHHVYMSSIDTKNWGPDQLGDSRDDTIEPGERFTLTGIEPDDYDVKLITGDGDVCEVDDVDFTVSYQLVITDDLLNECD